MGHSRGSVAALTVAASGAGVQAVAAADGTPAVSYVPQTQGSLLVIEGLSDTTFSPQTVMSYVAALQAAGKTVRTDYVPGAPHTLVWEAPWQSAADSAMSAFFRGALG